MYIYIYIYVYVCIDIYIYIHTYIYTHYTYVDDKYYYDCAACIYLAIPRPWKAGWSRIVVRPSRVLRLAYCTSCAFYGAVCSLDRHAKSPSRNNMACHVVQISIITTHDHMCNSASSSARTPSRTSALSGITHRTARHASGARSSM